MFFLIIIYLTFISLGLPDSLLGTTWPLMRLDLGMPIEAAGIISFIISGGTIVASFFSDKIIKRFKTGNVTFVSVLLTALALLGFSLATEFYMLVILAIPLGLGAGAIDSGLNKYVADNYDAKHMNWLHSFWGLGAIIGPLSISLFIGLQNGWRLGYLVISLAHFSIVLLLFTTLKKWQAKENDKDESIELNNDDFKKIGKKAMFAIFSSYLIYMLIESAIILWGATNYGGYIDASHSGEYSSGYYGYQIIYSLKKDEVLSFQIGSDYKGAANFGFSFINNNFEYDLENTNYIERLIYFPDGFEFKINVTETATYYLYFTENVTIKSDEEYISNGQFHIIELFAEENYYITPDAYDLKVRFKMSHIEENIVTTVNIVDGYGVYSMNSDDLIVLKLNIEKQRTYTLGISDEMYMFSWSSYAKNNEPEILNYTLFHGDSFNPNIENNNYIYLSYSHYNDNYERTIYIEFYDK